MTPTFTTEFDLVTKKLIVTDTFNYTDSVIDTAFGNATIKIGNQILHTNTNFNSSADIVIGVNTSFQIDLPLNADGTVRETDYEVTYDVRFTVNTNADVAADTFTVVTIPSNAALATLINESIAAGVGMKATFNVGSTSGYPIVEATSTTLTFASITISGAGTSLTSAIVASTSNSEAIENYSFCDITPISDLCVTSDCFYATLTAQDTTPYLASQTIVDRILTINWPRLANGNAVESPVVTEDASQTIGPNLYTGGYLVTLSTDITWTQTDGLIVTNTVAARSDYTVNCEGSICSAFNCIKAYMVKYQQAVALGSRDLAQFTQQNFQILLYCNLYNIAVECQDTAQARAILVALGEYMSINGVTVAGCDCGCGQSTTNSTEPTVIYPLYNSAVYNSATELAKGIAELANQTESEAAASEGTITNIDHTRILTPRGWRWAWNKALTLVWTFTQKITFQKGINMASAVAPSVLGDIAYNNDNIFAVINSGFVRLINTNDSASESAAGIAELATQTETNTGTDDTRVITPLKLTNRIASESLTGILALASTTEAQNAGDLSVNISTLNDTKSLTPKKWRQAWNKAAFNPANVATGVSPLFINATSGIANFTNIIPVGGIVLFEVSNSLVTTNSVIQYSLRYVVSNAANPAVIFYYIPYDGLIRFRVINFGDLATNTEISISFTILNP
jgi:hypothetical protein